jgi:hypothetical protein
VTRRIRGRGRAGRWRGGQAEQAAGFGDADFDHAGIGRWLVIWNAGRGSGVAPGIGLAVRAVAGVVVRAGGGDDEQGQGAHGQHGVAWKEWRGGGGPSPLVVAVALAALAAGPGLPAAGRDDPGQPGHRRPAAGREGDLEVHRDGEHVPLPACSHRSRSLPERRPPADLAESHHMIIWVAVP